MRIFNRRFEIWMHENELPLGGVYLSDARSFGPRKPLVIFAREAVTMPNGDLKFISGLLRESAYFKSNQWDFFIQSDKPSMP